MLTLVVVTSAVIVQCLSSEKPDSDMFSSTAEMSKLAKLEIEALDKLTALRALLENIENNLYAINVTMTEVKNVLQKFPQQDELQGAANGLFLLQETYKLNVSEFSGGIASSSKFKFH